VVTGKHLAALVLCLAALWASRFGPYTCATLPEFANVTGPAGLGPLASGFVVTALLYVPAYDFVAFLTFKLGLDSEFDPIRIYPGEDPPPGTQPISQSAKCLFYLFDLAVVGFILLPAWMKLAYCS
jgi:hypothetical protein